MMPIELHALPVREGDATLIVDRSATEIRTAILIDTGRRKDDAAAYLDRLGVKRLDLMLLSHIDLDHIGGMETILDRFAVAQIWCFDIYRLKDALDASPPKATDEKPTHKKRIRPFMVRLITADRGLRKGYVKGVPCWSVEEGHTETIGRVAIEVLWPPSSFIDHVLSPDNLIRFFSEKRPPVSWMVEGFEKGLESGTLEPNLGRREAQQCVKKLLSDRRIDEAIPKENSEGENLYGLDDTGFWPGEHFANNLSIVVRIKLLGDFVAGVPVLLFPGDLEDWTGILARQSPRLRASIWKVPHHGSRDVGFDFSPFFDEKFIYDVFHGPPGPFGPFWHGLWDEWLHWTKSHHRLPFPAPWALAMLPFEPRLWTGRGALQGGVHDVARIIDPAKTIVFPFPARGLPNSDGLETGVVWGEVVANRAPSPTLALKLNDRAREPAEAVITLAA